MARPLLEIDDHIACIVLNPPEVVNAIEELQIEFSGAVAKADSYKNKHGAHPLQ